MKFRCGGTWEKFTELKGIPKLKTGFPQGVKATASGPGSCQQSSGDGQILGLATLAQGLAWEDVAGCYLLGQAQIWTGGLGLLVWGVCLATPKSNALCLNPQNFNLCPSYTPTTPSTGEVVRSQSQ